VTTHARLVFVNDCRHTFSFVLETELENKPVLELESKNYWEQKPLFSELKN